MLLAVRRTSDYLLVADAAWNVWRKDITSLPGWRTITPNYAAQ